MQTAIENIAQSLNTLAAVRNASRQINTWFAEISAIRLSKLEDLRNITALIASTQLDNSAVSATLRAVRGVQTLADKAKNISSTAA